MRHRMKGRVLGRSPSHRRAMLKNLASSLFLSERSDEKNEAGEDYSRFDEPNVPKIKGRIITTLQKAKEVRPLVEKCITIARRSLASQQEAQEFTTDASRGSDEWKSWRKSQQWQQWNAAIAPALAARRRAIKLLGNKFAVSILFDEIAPRFAERDGGYTRILRLASPRLGDAGTRAIFEFVGQNDRVKQRSEKPSFATEEDTTDQDAIEETVSSEEQESAVEESNDISATSKEEE